MKYTNKKQKKRIANTQDIFNYHKNDKREAVKWELIEHLCTGRVL